VVSADGTPVTKMVLTLYPEDEANKRAAPATLLLDDTTGGFEGSCPPGRYKATLSPIRIQGANPAGGGGVPPEGAPNDRSLRFAPRYANATTTPLEVTVPEGGSQDLVVTLPRE
jgi:hypothetical protein